MSEELKQITKTFLSGKLSATLIIPIEIARRHGLERPAHVVVEETPRGILIRRVEVNAGIVGNTISGVDNVPR